MIIKGSTTKQTVKLIDTFTKIKKKYILFKIQLIKLKDKSDLEEIILKI